MQAGRPRAAGVPGREPAEGGATGHGGAAPGGHHQRLVGGPQAAGVLYRHHAPAGQHPGEDDHAGPGRHDRVAGGSTEVDPAVTRPVRRGGRVERPQHHRPPQHRPPPPPAPDRSAGATPRGHPGAAPGCPGVGVGRHALRGVGKHGRRGDHGRDGWRRRCHPRRGHRQTEQDHAPPEQRPTAGPPPTPRPEDEPRTGRAPDGDPGQARPQQSHAGKTRDRPPGPAPPAADLWTRPTLWTAVWHPGPQAPYTRRATRRGGSTSRVLLPPAREVAAPSVSGFRR